jgi:hypothetical protein
VRWYRFVTLCGLAVIVALFSFWLTFRAVGLVGEPAAIFGVYPCLILAGGGALAGADWLLWERRRRQG